MGQGLSCGERLENGLFRAVQNGDLEFVRTMVEADPSVLEQTTPRSRMSALHIAAAYGQIEVGFFLFSIFLFGESLIGHLYLMGWKFLLFNQILSLLLDRSVNPDVLNRNKQVRISTRINQLHQ